MPDHAGVVVAEDGPLAGHARHDGLAAAAEAGEEVRLDEARQDLEVAAHELGVEPGLVALRGHADADLGRGIESVVLDDAAPLEDRVPDHGPELGLGVGPVGAERVEEDDLESGDGVQDLQDGPEEERVGRGPGDIAEDDADAHAGADEVAEGRRADGRVERAADGGGRVGQGGNEGRLDDGDVERIVELERQPGFPVGQLDAHGGSLF